ncbi:hypothetical protein JCM11491_002961 [Sporobolomyces phaffii]
MDPAAGQLHELRTSYKLAAVSHFVGLYSHHLDFKHDVHELEQDLLPARDGNEKYLPYMLGKLLNTLANDRNTNHTNWLNALRRSYNRRVTLRSDNPFYQYLVVPDSVVRKELEAERVAAAAKGTAGSEDDNDDDPANNGHGGIFTESDAKLRAAEGKKPLKEKKRYPAAAPGVPMQENAFSDGFNAELADVVAEDAADGAATDRLEAQLGDNGEGAPEDEEFWEEQRAVEWKDLSLETKIDAIYNVCEWHMVDPDKQFRKYLQFDGESAWRLDPIGLDHAQNYYYHLSDDRLWVQRPVPTADEARALGCPDAPDPVTRPKSLLGLRAGPRDKSKKGTVTGTVRFKLRRDPKTGEFKQVRDDDDAAGPGAGAGAGAGARKKSSAHKDEDDDYEGGGRAAAAGAGDDDDDEEDLFAELEDHERAKKLEEREALEKQQRDRKEEDERELTAWERDVWAERWRAEHTPGFTEWECVCVSLDDWRAFAQRFDQSRDPDERDLRQYALDWIPEYEKLVAERARTREEEQAAAARQDATTRGARDSTMDTVARLAAEEAALADRFTRVTRGQLSSLDEGDAATASSHKPSSGAGGAAPPGESREERLKKREDEKRAREEAEEKRLLDEAREAEREEARQRNGGVLPYELMNDQERAEFDFHQEQERKRVQKEAEKKKREDIKRQRAKERRAELKAEKEAADAELAEFEAEINPHEETYAAPVVQQHYQQPPLAAAPLNEEPPWYTDCEVCGRQGWNIDDGVETICCEQCEEWQHLPCHIQRDALEGRQPVNYSDDAYKFYCIRCQQQPGRRPRPIPPAHELPPPPPPILVPPPAPAPAPISAGTKRKAAPKAQPAPKKAKPQKAPTAANGAMYGHGHHPLYHPSAYAHVPAQPVAQAPPQPAPQAAPQAAAAAAAAQPQMTYEELSNRVQQDPRLLAQLPLAYQQHFSEKFGIPLPQ